MGILKNGITGDFIGRAGNLVGYMLNGQNVIRTIGTSNKPKTEAQLNNLMQMEVINDFFYRMDGFLQKSFGPSCLGTVHNYQNLSIHYNKPHALKGYYPNVEIDYSKIVFSVGNLPQPVGAKLEWVDEGLKFIWDADAHTSFPECRDQVMMLVYFTDKDQNKRDVIYETSGAKRFKGFDILPVPSFYRDRSMEAYMTFIAEDRSDLSNSLYIGSLEP